MAEEEQDGLDKIIEEMSKDFQDVVPLHQISQQIGIEAGLIVVSLLFLGFFTTCMGILPLQICNFITIMYPLYMTLRSQQKHIENVKDYQYSLWMTFWIIYCFLLIGDQIVDGVHSLRHIYFPLKFMVLIWMQYPKTKGAVRFYNRFLRECFKDIVDRIDEGLLKSVA